MTARATYVCDGCVTATVDIPMPDTRVKRSLVDALVAAHWATPLPDVWLCPECAEITDIEGTCVRTEAMF